jgi:TorA maturation chaperone TorD
MASSQVVSPELSHLLKFLGRIWLKEVDLETLEAMREPGFFEPYRSLGGFVPESANDATVEELAVDYCRILVGPKNQISPVQSVWIENQFQSNSASSMKKFFDLLPDYQAPDSLSDHIGVQLDFLGTLTQEPNPEAKEIARLFCQKHLGWVDKFFDQVERGSNSNFYNGVTRVTRCLINEVIAAMMNEGK